MQLRRFSQFAILFSFGLVSCLSVPAQDSPAKRGRKYKPPPPTSRIEVTVLKKFNGKPISNAAVIFDATMDGKDQGSLEVKTDPEGKAAIDVIPTGSNVRVQVIAAGYATYAEEYVVSEPTREISISMIRPQEQLSSYQDNDGKDSSRKPGVQEPVRPTTPKAKPAVPPATPQPPQQPPSASDTPPKQ